MFEVDVPATRTTQRQRISLDGEWEYLADPRPAGIEVTEEAYNLARHFPGRIRIPGCWQGQTGKAAAGAFRFNHRERVWYRKQVAIPRTWDKRRVYLRLGGVVPAAEVWVNGTQTGLLLSSRSPMRADISGLVRPGKTNEIAVKTFYPPVRLDGTYGWVNGGWEGIYRSVALECWEGAAIADIFINAEAEEDSGTASVCLSFAPDAGLPKCALRLLISARDQHKSEWETTVNVSPKDSCVCIPIPTARLPRWSPESPALCSARAELMIGSRPCDEVQVPFGLRRLRVEKDQILLNGSPLVIRGCGDDQIHPATISPPASVEFHRKRLQQMKDYGFNLVSSYDLFTEECLQAADEVGMMMMQTMPFGFTAPIRNERFAPSPELEALFRRELDNIVHSQRNHPSAVCFAMSGELYYPEQNRDSFRLFCQDLPRRARELSPQALVMDANEGQGDRVKTDMGERETDLCEIMYFRDALRYGPRQETDRPAICHEFAWWSSYPDITKKHLYDGLPMEPYWLDEAEIAARRAGLLEELPRFVRNSRRLLALLRKEGLEKARLFGFAGYIMWLFQDTMWAVEGVVDDFGNPNGVTPEELRQSNADTIVIWDDKNRRTCLAGEKLPLELAVAASGSVRGDFQLKLEVTQDGDKCLSATLPVPGAPLARLPAVPLPLPQAKKPVTMTLNAYLSDKSGENVNENHWRFWVFPKVPNFTPAARIAVAGSDDSSVREFFGALPGGPGGSPALLVGCTRLEEHDIRYLEQGGRILLLSDDALPFYEMPDTDVFRTVPWNRGFTGHSGTVIYDHPALGDFPHEGFCDYSFVDLVIGGWPEERTWPFNLDAWRPFAPVRPIIRLIDHYRAARHKAHMFELAVGAGKLLATCLRFRWGIKNERPEARYLLRCLTEYALSDAFRPEAHVEPRDFRQVLSGPLRFDK